MILDDLFQLILLAAIGFGAYEAYLMYKEEQKKVCANYQWTTFGDYGMFIDCADKLNLKLIRCDEQVSGIRHLKVKLEDGQIIEFKNHKPDLQQELLLKEPNMWYETHCDGTPHLHPTMNIFKPAFNPKTDQVVTMIECFQRFANGKDASAADGGPYNNRNPQWKTYFDSYNNGNNPKCPF